MERLILYQVSDVHYPEYRDKRALDMKDPGFSSTVIEAMAPPRLTIAVRELLRRASRDAGCGLALCGDLTSVGSLDGYRECVSYLVKGLDLKSGPWAWRQAVPGNHDVDRVTVPVEDHDAHDKFVPLRNVWEDQGAPVLATRLERVQVSVGNSGLDLYGLNSCVGCGEYRHLPEDIREDLEVILRTDAEAAQKTNDAAQWERLDTPAFFEDDVAGLVDGVRATGSSRLAVIVAHHNLLPQALPRIAPYTELLNGGMVRERLTHLDQPVVYLHGHIHTSPIEVLLQPAQPRTRLVIVAAPLFVNGFNRLAFEFAEDGRVLGVEVTPVRVQESGGFGEDDPIRVPLTSPNDQGPSEILDAIMTVVRGASGRLRYPALQGEVKMSGRRPPEKRLQDVLREAEWLGLIRLVDRKREPRFWQVEWLGK